MFKSKKTTLNPAMLAASRPLRLVPRVKTFYATHTLGLESQVNAWLTRADTLHHRIQSVQYAQAKGEFSALIFYLQEEDKG